MNTHIVRKIGTKVRMRKDSEHYSQCLGYWDRPTEGEIVKYDTRSYTGTEHVNSGAYTYRVHWKNGHNNVYRPSDLIFIDQFKTNKEALSLLRKE